MCGTGAQMDLQGEQMAAYKQAQDMTKQEYGNQQAIYGPMSKQFESIFASGPNQEGFSAGETENLDAQAVEGTAENYKGAAKALNESQAAEGGGNIPMPSGAQEEQKAQLAESAAGQQSTEESQIQQADYQQGLQDWQTAAGGLETIAAAENPVAYQNASTNAGTAAGTTAQQIANENNSWETAAIGAVGAVGGAAVTAYCPAKGSRYLMFDLTWKPVEDLKVGDQLMGIGGDPQTVEEIQSARAPIVKVSTITEGIGRMYTARNSLTHAYALQHGGFVVAIKARGKQVRTLDGIATVIDVRLTGIEEVFNVVTDGSHTYCADGVWALGVGDAERRVDMETWTRLGAQMEAETR